MRKEQSFQQTVLRQVHMQRMHLEPHHTPYTKVYSDNIPKYKN